MGPDLRAGTPTWGQREEGAGRTGSTLSQDTGGKRGRKAPGMRASRCRDEAVPTCRQRGALGAPGEGGRLTGAAGQLLAWRCRSARDAEASPLPRTGDCKGRANPQVQLGGLFNNVTTVLNVQCRKQNIK